MTGNDSDVEEDAEEHCSSSSRRPTSACCRLQLPLPMMSCARTPLPPHSIRHCHHMSGLHATVATAILRCDC